MSCLQGCHVLPLWDGALQKQNEAQKLGPAPVSPSAIGHMFKLPMRHLSPKKALKIGLCRHGPSTAGSASSECFAGKTSGKLRRDWRRRYHHQGGRELVRQDEVRSGRKKEQEASLGLWDDTIQYNMFPNVHKIPLSPNYIQTSLMLQLPEPRDPRQEW